MVFNNTVVNLHYVNDPVWMERAFLLLKKHYQLVSVQQIDGYYHNNTPLRNSCHVTFDDGDDSFYRVVFPIIKKHQIPVSIYVSPKATIERDSFWFQKFKATDKEALKKVLLKDVKFAPVTSEIGGFPAIVLCKCMEIAKLNRVIDQCLEKNKNHSVVAKNMSIAQLLEVEDSGLVEIGAHTMNHPILSNESDADAEWEISSSITELSKLLGKTINYFAFPNGRYGLDFGDRELELISRNGIRLAFSTERKSFSKRDNPLLVPRKGLSHGRNAMILAKLILGKNWDSLKKVMQGRDETDLRIMLNKILAGTEK
ncbi:MAG: polysaccharide deacetylase [Candidatus Cloacimonetes bacterium HGW-Cloacimonetes-3]|jgi:peptidoglycan/xylan/chitin deacetylase (PgdA/CDA1 family)|nr:MAG: polysaccharide deacetylase [Candidatus Cloacimonetes bacterium HGW-Cloacimonetes-3]